MGRRNAFAIVAIVVTLTAGPAGAGTPGSSESLAADASCDDRVSAADIPALLRLIGSGGAACGRGDPNGDGSVDRVDAELLVEDLFAAIDIRFDFRRGEEGWTAGFADYAVGQEDSLALDSGVRPLPAELGIDGTGFYLQGNNVSDDLFMFLTRRLANEDGLRAGAAYDLTYELRFASNAPSDCSGIGGAPGESVILKAGGAPVAPRAVEMDGEIRMNVDKGNQTESGPAASAAGNIANGIPCEDGEVPYVSLTRRHIHSSPVGAGGDGSLWLLVGTDSGFEGLTGIYYERIAVQLVPRRAD
jgi:hypothetical protein